jgi:hypothetical protein
MNVDVTTNINLEKYWPPTPYYGLYPTERPIFYYPATDQLYPEPGGGTI